MENHILTIFALNRVINVPSLYIYLPCFHIFNKHIHAEMEEIFPIISRNMLWNLLNGTSKIEHFILLKSRKQIANTTKKEKIFPWTVRLFNYSNNWKCLSVTHIRCFSFRLFSILIYDEWALLCKAQPNDRQEEQRKESIRSVSSKMEKKVKQKWKKSTKTDIESKKISFKMQYINACVCTFHDIFFSIL